MEGEREGRKEGIGKEITRERGKEGRRKESRALLSVLEFHPRVGGIFSQEFFDAYYDGGSTFWAIFFLKDGVPQSQMVETSFLFCLNVAFSLRRLRVLLIMSNAFSFPKIRLFGQVRIEFKRRAAEKTVHAHRNTFVLSGIVFAVVPEESSGVPR